MENDADHGMDEEDTNMTGANGAEGEDSNEQQTEMNTEVPQQQKTKSYPASFGLADREGEDAVINEVESEKPSNDAEPSSAEGSSGHGKGEGQEVSGGANNAGISTAPLSKGRNDNPPNPFQEKGDISSAWYRRLDIITNDNSDDQPLEDPPSQGKGTFEFANKDSNSAEQVLAGAVDEEIAALPDSHEELQNTTDPQTEDELLHEAADDSSKDKSARERKIRNEDEHHPFTTDEKIEDNNRDITSAGESTTVGTISSGLTRPGAQDHHATFSKAIEYKDEETYEESLLSIDAATSVEIQSSSEADRQWLWFRNQTEVYSIRLCEQLRLILEPQLASRLEGDYRSGKRVSMRKVIGYVASGFRKDKIWLRRTKPSKRDYQVMLLVDDSKSMKEAGALTMAAVATIATALSKLEVGDVCVASFADKVRILHGFGNALSLNVL